MTPAFQQVQSAAGFLARVLIVRLRFVLAVVAAGLVVANWNSIRAAFDRALGAPASTALAVSGDTEYFCPMCPGVLSDWPAKCPVCYMTLVRRKRGDATPLPDGVIARMQLTPYRVTLAGIRTEPVGFKPLEKTTTLTGRVLDRKTVELRARPGDDVPAGRRVLICLDEAAGRPTVEGSLRDTGAVDAANGAVLVDLAEPLSARLVGTVVVATVASPAAAVEPFLSLSNPPALNSDSVRVAYRCPDHPDQVQLKEGTCPIDRLPLVRRPLAENQRLDWWCPMHPRVVSAKPVARCEQCKGMELRPRVLTYAPTGQALAVPRSAVVDTGSRKLVFIERMAGMYDAVEVQLGPSCGDWYPVAHGLEPGDRVAIGGGFLLDAETQLSRNLASAYFGAQSSTPTADQGAASQTLSEADKEMVARQKVCPVTNLPLDSMGGPRKVVIGERTVFICCEGCEVSLREDPGKYLGRLKDGAQSK